MMLIWGSIDFHRYIADGISMVNISIIVKILREDRFAAGYQEYLRLFFVELVFFTADRFTSIKYKRK